MTVDATLTEIGRRGLRVTNLFQLESGPWRANLTDGMTWFEFGTGESAVEALGAALAKCKEEEGVFG